MAGPIGMAVLRGMQAVTCPHCGARQARDRHAKSPVTCKVCKKPFELPGKAGAGAAKKKPRR